MSNVKSNIRLGAAAVALTFAAALPAEVPYTAGLLGTSVAQAGVWGSVKGAAKKVGGGVDRVATKVGKAGAATGKAIGSGGAIAGKAIARGYVKAFGEVPYRIGVKVGEAGAATGRAVADGAVKVGAAAKAVGRGVKAISRPTGQLTHVPAQPGFNRPLPKPPAGQPGSWGGDGRPSETVPIRKPADTAPPNQGISKPDLGIKQDKSVWGRPIGASKPALGNDKSVWGRPVGVPKPKLTQGATRDLKPMRQSMSRKGR